MAEKNLKRCVPPCSRFITAGDSHDLCLECLGEEHALAAFENADCGHCDALSRKVLRSRREFFNKAPMAHAPRGSAHARAEAERRLRSWGSQLDLADEMETDSVLSLSGSVRSNPPSVASEARSAVSSAPRGRAASSVSEETEAPQQQMQRGSGNLPPQSVEYEELVEVISHAADRFEVIDWQPAREQQQLRLTGMLDERELPSRVDPPLRHLPFCPELHDAVSKSWKNPYSARLMTPKTAIYSAVRGLGEKACTVMPMIEEDLARRRPDLKSARVPPLSSRPLRVTSGLVGKAYMTAGQSVGCLHTMSVLQAYKADLIKECLDGVGSTPEQLREALRASDLALRATKEAASSLGRSMATLVAAEQHLWLTQAEVSETDRAIFMDASISSSGLFGDAVDCVPESFDRVKKTL
ncbi:uncharacterized protein [Danio rerio]|uniref:Uncharacterized protein n=1 Tax=Danio rerio TaxID=7955 RepID=A0AC58GSP9_DANRE